MDNKYDVMMTPADFFTATQDLRDQVKEWKELVASIVVQSGGEYRLYEKNFLGGQRYERLEFHREPRDRCLYITLEGLKHE